MFEIGWKLFRSLIGRHQALKISLLSCNMMHHGLSGWVIASFIRMGDNKFLLLL